MNGLIYNTEQLKELLENGQDSLSKELRSELYKNKAIYKTMLNWKDRSYNRSIIFGVILNKKLNIFSVLLKLGLVDIARRDNNGLAILAFAIKVDSDVVSMLMDYIVENDVPYKMWCSESDLVDVGYKKDGYELELTIYHAMRSEGNKYLPWVFKYAKPSIKKEGTFNHVMGFFTHQIKLEGAKPITRISNLVADLHKIASDISELNHPMGKLLYAMDSSLVQSFTVRMLTEKTGDRHDYYFKMVASLEKLMMHGDLVVDALPVEVSSGRL